MLTGNFFQTVSRPWPPPKRGLGVLDNRRHYWGTVPAVNDRLNRVNWLPTYTGHDVLFLDRCVVSACDCCRTDSGWCFRFRCLYNTQHVSAYQCRSFLCWPFVTGTLWLAASWGIVYENKTTLLFCTWFCHLISFVFFSWLNILSFYMWGYGDVILSMVVTAAMLEDTITAV